MTYIPTYICCGVVAAATFGLALDAAWASNEVDVVADGSSDGEPNTSPSQPPEAEAKTDLRLNQARELFVRGSRAFHAGNHSEAIGAFLLADELVPSAALSFNVARVYEAMGNTGQTILWLMDYLRRSPNAEDEAAVRAKVADLDATLVREGQQLVIVRCDPDSQVYLGQTHLGTCPLGVVVDLGVASFRLVNIDRRELRRDISVTAAGVEVLDVSFPAETETASTRTRLAHNERENSESASTIVKVPAILPPPVQPTVIREPTASPDSSLSNAGLVVLGCGVLGLGLSGSFELARRSAEEDAGNTPIQVEKRAAIDRMSDWQTAARLSAAIGGGLLLGGGVMWWLGGKEANSSEAVRIGVVPELAIGTAGVRVTGSY